MRVSIPSCTQASHPREPPPATRSGQGGKIPARCENLRALYWKMRPSRHATSMATSTPTSTMSGFSARVRSAQHPGLFLEPRKFTCGKSSTVSPPVEKSRNASPILLLTAHGMNSAPGEGSGTVRAGKGSGCLPETGQEGRHNGRKGSRASVSAGSPATPCHPEPLLEHSCNPPPGVPVPTTNSGTGWGPWRRQREVP